MVPAESHCWFILSYNHSLSVGTSETEEKKCVALTVSRSLKEDQQMMFMCSRNCCLCSVSNVLVHKRLVTQGAQASFQQCLSFFSLQLKNRCLVEVELGDEGGGSVFLKLGH